jgi:hypothetical protein
MRRVVVHVILALLPACAAGLPSTPSRAETRWIELTSEHFTVWTDAEPPRARELVRKMEHLRHVVSRIAYPTSPTQGRSLVILLRNDQELRAFDFRGEARAYSSLAAPPLWQPVMVLSLTSGEDGDRLLAHELTHVVSSSVIHEQPRWLAEGMAEFFETMQLNDERTTVMVGAPPRVFMMPSPLVRPVPIAQLFAWRGLSSYVREYSLYAKSWALFAFLLNEHPNELAHYLWLIDRTGDPANGALLDQQQRAWDVAFPSLPVAALDEVLGQWIEDGSHMMLKFLVKRSHWPVVARWMTDADVYAVRALMLADGAQQRRQREELAASLAAEPTNVLAWVVKVSLGEKLPIEDARALAAAHPDDWRAWWLATTALSEAQGDPAEVEHGRGKACQLIEQNRAVIAPPWLCPPRLAPRPPR